jgi:hypothetical protein
MAFHFTLTRRVEDWRNAIAAFIRDVVIAREEEDLARVEHIR